MEMLMVLVTVAVITYVIGISMTMTSCKYCRKQISRKATVCPHCQNETGV